MQKAGKKLAGKDVSASCEQKKILEVDAEKCSGCRMCELVCSWHHQKEFRPSLARLFVVGWKEEGLDYPLVCQQCEKAPCKDACPVEAITIDKTTGAWVIDSERCIGCRNCVVACPFGVVIFHPEKNVALKCDLCGGQPMCVEFCPMSALNFAPPGQLSGKRRKKAADSLFVRNFQQLANV